MRAVERALSVGVTDAKAYQRYRDKGYRAQQAWDIIKADGITSTTSLRVRFVPDEEIFDDSYLDTWGMRPSALKREREALWKMIEDEGVWGYVLERPCPHCGHYEEVDSCWGFVGLPDDYSVANAVLAAS